MHRKPVSKWYRLERAHETRMWIKEICIPVGLAGAIVFSDPEARDWAKSKWTAIKSKFKRNSKKEEAR